MSSNEKKARKNCSERCLNTFHSMGGIKCITLSGALPPANSIKRLKSVPTAEEVTKLGVLELLMSEKIVVQDLNMLNPIPSKIFAPYLPDRGKWGKTW
ncbi:hypothetical protein AVEN_54592-1 [Araneus ventricosus]|uniref:Uncharacterized protein n=1 Tax=Araneus ventricosus TaxID=182803 RepID=A0A4Y2BL51_ARAVE|nr:hypothetical protein AVEN_54592-1 [Araneus ventricosus]